MTENLYTRTYRRAINMHESGMQQNDVLTYLASAAESAAGTGTAASILLLDEQGLLRNGASPQLPPDYLAAIDGLKPDANVGTCAAAAATGNVVITPSFYADNKWAELRHLPLALGYVAAWSVPIKNGDNKVIGTFGTYFRQYRLPSDEEVSGTTLLASAAALVLGNDINPAQTVNDLTQQVPHE
jgi:GAF domain-containing protein